MGQYYKTLLKNDYWRVITRDFREGWIGLKLMEHSFLNCVWVDTIAREIYKTPTVVAHVGDYATDSELYTVAYNGKLDIINDDKCYVENDFVPFEYEGKYLVNHTLKVYLSFDKYIPESKAGYEMTDTVCPFTLLTALGNGRGNGDYNTRAKNSAYIGTWACHTISIEDDLPEGYTEVVLSFEDY